MLHVKIHFLNSRSGIFHVFSSLIQNSHVIQKELTFGFIYKLDLSFRCYLLYSIPSLLANNLPPLHPVKSFLSVHLQNIPLTQSGMNWSGTCFIILFRYKAYIPLGIPYRKKVELFVLHVHFICVGLNCQYKRKETPGGM